MITESGEFNVVESFLGEPDEEVFVVCGCEEKLVGITDAVGGRHQARRGAERIQRPD